MQLGEDQHQHASVLIASPFIFVLVTSFKIRSQLIPMPSTGSLLPVTCAALAQLRFRSVTYYNICKQLRPSLHEAQPHRLALILWSLQQLQYLPDDTWLQEAQQVLLAGVAELNQRSCIVALTTLAGFGRVSALAKRRGRYCQVSKADRLPSLEQLAARSWQSHGLWHHMHVHGSHSSLPQGSHTLHCTCSTNASRYGFYRCRSVHRWTLHWLPPCAQGWNNCLVHKVKTSVCRAAWRCY